jgi:hypothetical protein
MYHLERSTEAGMGEGRASSETRFAGLFSGETGALSARARSALKPTSSKQIIYCIDILCQHK